MIINCAERTSLGGSGNAHCCQILSMGRSPYHRHCGAVAVQLRCSCGAVVVQLSCVSLGVEEFLSPVYDLNEFLHPQGHEAIREKSSPFRRPMSPVSCDWAWVQTSFTGRGPFAAERPRGPRLPLLIVARSSQKGLHATICLRRGPWPAPPKGAGPPPSIWTDAPGR